MSHPPRCNSYKWASNVACALPWELTGQQLHAAIKRNLHLQGLLLLDILQHDMDNMYAVVGGQEFMFLPLQGTLLLHAALCSTTLVLKLILCTMTTMQQQQSAAPVLAWRFVTMSSLTPATAKIANAASVIRQHFSASPTDRPGQPAYWCNIALCNSGTMPLPGKV